MRVFYVLFIVIVFSACQKNYYVIKDMPSRAKQHNTIAVVPVKVIITGKKPKGVTDEQIVIMEQEDSKTYQQLLFDQLLANSNNKKKQLHVNVQSPNQTLKKLTDAGITIRQSWETSAAQLKQVLGVDAVIFSTVKSKRFMSDLASYGIEMGTEVLEEVVLDNIPVVGDILHVPRHLSRTSTVAIHLELVNAADETVLFNNRHSFSTSYGDGYRKTVSFAYKKMTRSFPYRGKHYE